jgi:hypothetical protein
MRLSAETVSVELAGRTASVTATFTLEVGALDRLRYCRPLQSGGTECGSWYYQFDMLWPLLPGQRTALHDPSIEVNGRAGDVWDPSYVREGEGPKLAGIESWFKFSSPRLDAEPKPETFEVVVRYTETLGFEGGRARFTYVLRSGALWTGTIGKAEVTFRATEGLCLEDPRPPIKAASTPCLTTATWTLHDLDPDQDLSVTVIPRP